MPIITVKDRVTGHKKELIVPHMDSPIPDKYERVFVPTAFSIGNTFRHLSQTPFKENIKKLAHTIENAGGKWPAATSKQKLRKVWGI